MKLPTKQIWVSTKDYVFIAVGLLIFAIGFCVFVVPEEVITGGMAGISQIVYILSYRLFGWGIPLGVTIYTLNLVLLAFAYRIVGGQFVVRTIFGVTLIALYVGILQPICTHPLVPNATFMNVIIGSLLCGIGMGLTFSHNGCSGGTDIVVAMVVKRTNASLGRTMQLCDLCIISSSLLLFGLQTGFEKLVYGIILMLIISITCEQVVNSNKQAVQFIIFSPKWEEIATAINNDAHRGCTVLNGMGFYSKQEMKVLLVMCRKMESQTIYRIIRSIDPNALISQANVNGVYGEGFDELKLRMKVPTAKNLMFDLGGVIMDLKRDNAVVALKKLGIANADELLGVYGQKGIFLQLERGEITPADFRNELRKDIPRQVSDKEIDDAFSEFLLGIPEKRLQQLRELRKRYNIYLLSNTNEIMWVGRIADEFRKEGHNLEFYFDGVVASFQVHAYKPDAEIFHIAEQKFGIKPEDTIFFDDSEANVEAARALGFKAVHVTDPDRTFESYIAEAK